MLIYEMVVGQIEVNQSIRNALDQLASLNIILYKCVNLCSHNQLITS